MDAPARSGRTSIAAEIMEQFAERTGISSSKPQERYLWTDAFAVCNYLTLFGCTGAERYRELAVRLIDHVHHVLGRHRDDDPRQGWISGLSERDGEQHPTAGGLRIGKRLKERAPGEPYDERLEWDRDGQYYHYLVRWIHALMRAGDVLDEDGYHGWAAELAEVANETFVHVPRGGGVMRMYWKMSVDLTRALVPSEGAHDPLDGLVTSIALESGLPDRLSPRPRLARQVQGLAEMCADRSWTTDDPLGAGGLLMDACWVTKLLRGGESDRGELLLRLAPRLWEDAALSVHAVARGYPFDAGPSRRMAFRELGLAIGLAAVEATLEVPGGFATEGARSAARSLGRYTSLSEGIVSSWLSEEARATASWEAHRNINDVMLATALAPDEYVDL